MNDISAKEEYVQGKKADNRERMKIIAVRALPYVALIAIIVFFAIMTQGAFLKSNNITLVFKQSFSVLLTASAAVFVLATGNLDFSIGANVGFTCACACLAAYVDVRLALPVALIAGTIVGIITGLIHVVLKIPSIIGCLCMSFILFASAQTLVGGTNLAAPVSMLDTETVPLLLGTITIFLAVLFIALEYTKVGKQLKAIGISPEAARQSGVNVGKMKVLAYAITGFAAGLAGYFVLLRAGSASPFVGQTVTTDVIIACVVGGMSIAGGTSARISAAVVGTLIIYVINNGLILAGMGGEFPQLIKGLIFILVVTATTKRSMNTIVK